MAMTSVQRNVVIAGFLGWTLDAFDFFILIFAAKAIAADFHVGREDVIFAVTLTLLARPFGAFVFGLLADRFGRRPMLMLDIALFSFFELASAFAPNLAALFVLRVLFGFAMGGEWGLGSSLTMEIIPEKSRGFVSGLLQEGYACGNLLAALLFWAAVRPHRLARHVHRRLPAVAARAVHPLDGSGIASMAARADAEPATSAIRSPR